MAAIAAVRPLKDPDLARMTRAPRFMAMFLIFGIVGLFGYWSYVAPLEGAVVANGSVVLDSNRKLVQHLEGGIIDKIEVRNGDAVKQGDPLIILDNSMVEGKRNLFLWNLHVEMAGKARLVAERDGLKEVPFAAFLESIRVGDGKAELSAKEKEDLEKTIEQQKNIFSTRRRSLDEQVGILKKRIAQMHNQIGGLSSQLSSTREQVALIRDELSTVRQLLARGLEQRPRLLSLQRREAELQGQIGEYQSQIAKVQDAINETNLTINNVTTERQKEVAEELKVAQAKIAELEENYMSLSNVSMRTVIAAPQAGVITNMKFHTTGGVIPPGAPILEIVPQNDELVIDVRLKPMDIESVHMEQDAQVLLSAYLARHVPKLLGKVSFVSPDRLQDEVTGDPYYQVRVKISPEELAKVSDQVTLYPGMPAEVFLVTEERTMFEYLIFPIRSSMNRAFRE
jgi:HlyD family type I secretion membrane fusion protein